MGRALTEDVSYYIETFLDRIEKLWSKWRYLSWETKVRAKGVLSVSALLLSYYVYARSWLDLSDLWKVGLALFALLALAVFVSTVFEVLGFKG